MAAELTPITDRDVPAVADFLRAHLDHRVPWETTLSAVPWKGGGPNHGFMLRDGRHVVGTLLALYSERLVSGRVERFCNMGSWCVLPDYRSRSILLIKALLAQDGYHFTVLSPDDGPQEILAWLGFRFLDTSAAFVPNLPWPTPPGRMTVSTDPAVIGRTLAGTDLEIYRDHERALAVHHLVVVRGAESCHVMYRVFRHRGVPVYAVVLHVSNPDLLLGAWKPLTRHLLLRRGLVATLAELRIVGHMPPFAFALNDRPKMYRSAALRPDQIDYLYSELACVPW
ncbi:hypothetical protein [Mycolicibacterium litorale]|uniref:N-acetyltransferase domain-containing protein n=1 Tax=Mycolicibacterium litorale TaxID=758802 RepID=A0AAD1IQG4_9MYCO|nr:hypothetical protein [Mycolicibacterium litorale]MCV7418126.1 hypothetical protein [Mycolicibacterium litorale]TDY06486.1 hypothetical protein BCL50_2811 [Mycolicibacterium litorale]BBY19369.1 hypothetical protein MLIT_49610 [Mycolicibacterium litorale]